MAEHKPTEQWRSIKGHEGTYEVSDRGVVVRREHWKHV